MLVHEKGWIVLKVHWNVPLAFQFSAYLENMYSTELCKFGSGCRVAANQDPREAGRKTRRRLPGQVKRKWSDRGRPRALRRSSPVGRWKFWASWETERRKNRRTVSGTTPKVCCDRTLEVRVHAPPRLCGVRPLFQSRWIHQFFVVSVRL